jgi:hypothetical protein
MNLTWSVLRACRLRPKWRTRGACEGQEQGAPAGRAVSLEEHEVLDAVRDLDDAPLHAPGSERARALPPLEL